MATMQAYSQFQDGDSGQPQEQGNSNPYHGWQMAAGLLPFREPSFVPSQAGLSLLYHILFKKLQRIHFRCRLVPFVPSSRLVNPGGSYV
nr:MAG TPA: hypothetical protein [Caudoviricetes sp.]